MPYQKEIVTDEVKNAQRLPDCTTDLAVIVEMLSQNGTLGEFSQRFRVERKAGSYQSIDAFLLFILVFTASFSGGINGISKRVEKDAEKLGALAGRKRMMTQQSCSRFLKSIQERHVNQAFSDWLLIQASGAIEVMNNPLGSVYDSTGEEWRFYDFDGTLLTVRQRALPLYEELPDPKRLDEKLVAPGYSGRKRGEMQLCRETLQDAGSGIWLGCYCSPGNGKKSNVEKAAKVVASTMREMGKEPNRAIMRLDGYYSSWPVILACQKANIIPLTRWHSEVLHWSEVSELIKEATWQPVADSCSGPQRYATEGGIITDPKGKSDAWGRLVISRYRDVTGRGNGTTIGEWRYEVFITQLPSEQWPASHVVAAYFGRVGQENRFAQEDRELNLDRLFSFSLPGQIFATWIGLFVWNLKTVMGFKMVREQLPREPPQTQDAVKERTSAVFDTRLLDALDELPWSEIEADKRRKNLKWRSGEGLTCLAGQLIPFKGTNENMGKVVFRARPGTCRNCEVRSSCTQSKNSDHRREFTFQVEDKLRKRLAKLRRERLPSIKLEKIYSNLKAKTTPKTWSDPVAAEPGPLSVSGPFFIPSELRHKAENFAIFLEVKVSGSNINVIPQNPFVAKTASRRQRRRSSWSDRLAWNAANGSFKISFAGPYPGYFDQLLKVLVEKSKDFM